MIELSMEPADYDVYFHDGDVLPINLQQKKMIPFSHTKLNFAGTAKRARILTMTKERLIFNQDTQHCNNDPGKTTNIIPQKRLRRSRVQEYSWIECWEKFVFKYLDCRLPWEQWKAVSNNVTECTDIEAPRLFERFVNIFSFGDQKVR